MGMLRCMSEPETPQLELRVQVMFYDTDCAAVVHNLAYLRQVFGLEKTET